MERMVRVPDLSLVTEWEGYAKCNFIDTLARRLRSWTHYIGSCSTHVSNNLFITCAYNTTKYFSENWYESGGNKTSTESRCRPGDFAELKKARTRNGQFQLELELLTAVSLELLVCDLLRVYPDRRLGPGPQASCTTQNLTNVPPFNSVSNPARCFGRQSLTLRLDDGTHTVNLYKEVLVIV